MAKSKDLFDDSAMSFGEHLEILRIHLWKAIIGLVICVIASLFFGKHVIAFVRAPVDDALEKYNLPASQKTEDLQFDFVEWIKGKFGYADEEKAKKREEAEQEKKEGERLPPNTIAAKIRAADVYDQLKTVAPKSVADTERPDEEKWLKVQISAPEFDQLRTVVKKQSETVSLTVQEAFMTYLKVALVAGFVIASPWIFYQLWLFVAAGLYPHEKRYVYIYLPFSISLFIGGALFCFYLVFPFILDFLFGFNEKLGVHPQIRLSEWISFAIILPMMFGVSFQLPLVMLFLERISVFTTEDYRSKRRMAVLVIAVISMLLTPADPMSMMMMMLPLVVLYEMGIVLCNWTTAPKSPFEESPA